MTNQELLDRYAQYLTARGYSLNYRNTIRLWLAYMEEKHIETVTQDVITQFFTENSKYSLSSKNQFIKAGRSFGDFLQIPKEQNEWYKIKLLKVETRVPDYLSEEDFEKGLAFLITHQRGDMTSLKLRALFHFIFFSAGRRSEVVNVKRENFNLIENYVIFFGKGKKERFAYFPERVGKEIQEYFNSEKEVTNAFNISAEQVIRLLNKMSKFLGRHVYWHLIRHSSCRFMQRQGIPMTVVKDIMGHSSIQTTLRYSGENETGRRELYKEKIK
jgi:integrase/recombinase XerD